MTPSSEVGRSLVQQPAELGRVHDVARVIRDEFTIRVERHAQLRVSEPALDQLGADPSPKGVAREGMAEAMKRSMGEPGTLQESHPGVVEIPI